MVSAWRPCCGDCGFEHLQEAEGHPLYCGRCGAPWDGSEIVPYPCGRGEGPSNWRWRFFAIERRLGRVGFLGQPADAEYREWVAMVVGG